MKDLQRKKVISKTASIEEADWTRARAQKYLIG
jgi:hypothetical protein